MNIHFKKTTKYIIAGIISAVIASFLFVGTAVADSNASLWKLTTGKLMPVVASWGLKIPSLGGAGTTCLQADNTGVVSGTGSACGGGGGGSPAGSNTYIQYNDAGAFGADAKLAYTASTDILTVGDKIAAHSALDLTVTTSAGTFLMKFGESGGQQTTWYGNLKSNSATASRLAYFDGSKNLTFLDTASYPSLTEISNVKGVTSNIQTQISAGKMRIGNSVESANNYNVLFTDGSGKLAQNNGYFQYANKQLIVLADSGYTPLRLLQNSGVNIAEFYSGITGTTSKYMIVDEDLNAGYEADIGSWGLGGPYFEIKYGYSDEQWGKVLYQSVDGYIRKPQYEFDGTMDMYLDTGSGGFFAGDILGVADNLILQIGLGQIVFGNYSGTSFYLDDVAGQVILAFGGVNTIDFTSNGLSLYVAGTGLSVKEGTNATMGVCTLVAGTCTVSTTKAVTSSRIFLTAQNVSGTEYGTPRVSTRTSGTSFVITSYRGNNSTTVASGDTSTVAWQIVQSL